MLATIVDDMTDTTSVRIGVSQTRFWDLASVEALDRVVPKLRRCGARAEVRPGSVERPAGGTLRRASPPGRPTTAGVCS